MVRIMGLCRYRGSEYKGWQQQQDVCSVQAAVSRVASLITASPILVQGAGRTDSGVHALAYPFHFDINAEIVGNLDEIYRLFKAHLPLDIQLYQLQIVNRAFHVRYSAVCKWYRYVIFNDQDSDREQYGWRVSVKDWGIFCRRMQELSSEWLGKHDFKFMIPPSMVCGEYELTDRMIFVSNIVIYENMIIYDVVGSGFFNKMVRRMVGSMVQIAKGCSRPLGIRKAIELQQIRMLGEVVAPAKGLYLMRVFYNKEDNV